MAQINNSFNEMTLYTNNITLSPEQQQAFDDFTAGKNIFLTGPGGSGKSELIRRIVSACDFRGKNCQVCALTGCAAVLLNCKAKTVHSWAGIGLANGENNEIINKIMNGKQKNKIIKKWQNVDVLIIDEVSMMSKKIFELLDEMGKRLRKVYVKPFGGIQVIFSGDFYQLPPVGKGDDDSSAFCFESPLWDKTFHSVVHLKKIFRQSDDTYSNILNQIRIGKLYKSGLDTLLKHVGKSYPDDSFRPTKLYPKKKEVEQINNSEYIQLPGEENVYKIRKVNPETLLESEKDKQEFRSIPENVKEFEYEYLKNNINAEEELRLKIGTQVMCTVNFTSEDIAIMKIQTQTYNLATSTLEESKLLNLEQQLVNGSQGIVIDFKGEKKVPIVKFNNGLTVAMDSHNWVSENIKGIALAQIPLIHAWALTIHKAQGATLDAAEINAGSNIFECGQTYVALSRVKSLDGLYLTAFDPSKIKVNKKVQDYYKGNQGSL